MANRCGFCYAEHGYAPKLGDDDVRILILGSEWVEWGLSCGHGDQKLLKRMEPDGSETEWTPNEVWAFIQAEKQAAQPADPTGPDGLPQGDTPPPLSDADHRHDTYRDMGANRYE